MACLLTSRAGTLASAMIMPLPLSARFPRLYFTPLHIFVIAARAPEISLRLMRLS